MVRIIGKYLQKVLGKSKIMLSLQKSIIAKKAVNTGADYQPLFIVGLPRSGTTVLYQMLLTGFRFAYFSNLANVFYGYPLLILILFKRKHLSYRNTQYKSNYGYVSGIFAPSESGSIFRYWSELEFGDGVVHVVKGVMRFMRAPLIFKNLNATFHIKEIEKLFPNAIFVYVERDLKDVCVSNYLGFLNDGGIEISGLSKKSLESEEDILAKIGTSLKKINENLMIDLDQSKCRYLKIDYVDLCDNSANILQEIRELFDENSKPDQKELIIPGNNIKRSKPKIKLTDEEESVIKRLFD